MQKKIKIEKIDVTDFKKLGHSIQKNKPDVIIHLAGQTSHSQSFEQPLMILILMLNQPYSFQRKSEKTNSNAGLFLEVLLS